MNEPNWDAFIDDCARYRELVRMLRDPASGMTLQFNEQPIATDALSAMLDERWNAWHATQVCRRTGQQPS